jgi:hypothetical protein
MMPLNRPWNSQCGHADLFQDGHLPLLISPNAVFDLRKTTDFAILDGLGVVRVRPHPYRRGWQSPAGRWTIPRRF